MTFEQTGSRLSLCLRGDLDLATVGQLMAAVDRIDIAGVDLLVLNLQGVDFIDLAGLKAILRSVDYCTDRAIRVTVVKPRGFASRVFTLTRAHLDLDLIDQAPPERIAVRPWIVSRPGTVEP